MRSKLIGDQGQLATDKNLDLAKVFQILYSTQVAPRGAHLGHQVVTLQLGYLSFSYQTETFRAGQGGPPEHVQKFS